MGNSQRDKLMSATPHALRLRTRLLQLLTSSGRGEKNVTHHVRGTKDKGKEPKQSTKGTKKKKEWKSSKPRFIFLSMSLDEGE